MCNSRRPVAQRVRIRCLAVSCLTFWIASCCTAGAAAADPSRKTENVVVVTLDGFRYQELFAGADDSLLNEPFGGVRDVERIRTLYLRKTAEERREVLLPFVWGVVAKQGQLFGDRSCGAAAKCLNGLKFSYPGYNELFCGFGGERIRSNSKTNNPNLSVFEFLHQQPAYRERVAVFCTWGVFPYIFRSSANGLKVHAGWTPIDEPELTERQQAANARMTRLPRYWPDNTFDLVTIEAVREHLRRHKPRVLYIGLGETDEWAHGRRYDLYLDAAHNADRFLAELWTSLQGLSEYRDRTTLLITTDHGRGPTRHDWTDHGEKVPDAEHIWIAALGPDTPALGVRENVDATQGQVAATIARLLGEDFCAAAPRAAPPLPIFGQ